MWSKICRTCGNKIFWENAKHMFVEFDDDQKGTHRHLCPLNPDNNGTKAKETVGVTSEQIDSLARQLISISSDIAMLRKAHHETSMAVFEIQRRLT